MVADAPREREGSLSAPGGAAAAGSRRRSDVMFEARQRGHGVRTSVQTNRRWLMVFVGTVGPRPITVYPAACTHTQTRPAQE